MGERPGRRQRHRAADQLAGFGLLHRADTGVLVGVQALANRGGKLPPGAIGVVRVGQPPTDGSSSSVASCPAPRVEPMTRAAVRTVEVMTMSFTPEPVPVPIRVLLPGDQEVVAHLWSRRQAPDGSLSFPGVEVNAGHRRRSECGPRRRW